nr:MAG TPA: Rad50 zinc hook motif [Caudoviricetes sp.]
MVDFDQFVIVDINKISCSILIKNSCPICTSIL